MECLKEVGGLKAGDFHPEHWLKEASGVPKNPWDRLTDSRWEKEGRFFLHRKWNEWSLVRQIHLMLAETMERFASETWLLGLRGNSLISAHGIREIWHDFLAKVPKLNCRVCVVSQRVYWKQQGKTPTGFCQTWPSTYLSVCSVKCWLVTPWRRCFVKTRLKKMHKTN